MIHRINTAGRYIEVKGGDTSTYVSKTYNSNSKMQGDMYYDIDTQSIKVFNGSDWQPLVGPTVTIDLSYEAQSLLDWARKKRMEEEELERLAKEHPAINDLANKVKLYQDQIKMVKTLIKKDHEWVTTEAEQAQSAP